MGKISTNKETLKRCCESLLTTHTDFTGTHVETRFECNSVDDFVNRLFDELCNSSEIYEYEKSWQEYIEECNAKLNMTSIHATRNNDGGYTLYYMFEENVIVVEGNMQECDLIGRISKLYRYMKALDFGTNK